MYNSIYPVNINYSNHNKYKSINSKEQQSSLIENKQEQNANTFPNGAKTAIDYSKGQINISQVITDFKNTIIAINTPENIADDVNLYLKLVEKESLKENPSKDIILSNLKNASKICDAYIADSLKKPSNVVEGWIDALFLQNINLKSDPTQINPDFLLEFPQKAQEKIDTINDTQKQANFLSVTSPDSSAHETNITNTASESNEINISNVINPEIIDNSTEIPEEIQIESNLELSEENDKQNLPVKSEDINSFNPIGKNDEIARNLFIQAKQEPDSTLGDTNKLNMLNEALGLLNESEEYNNNIKAALHFERAKIFDDYDYVDYALRDYSEATKALDNNLKAQAFYKSGKIYDEFNEFNPALDNYLSCVAYSGQAENFIAQSLALTSIASLYASKFDLDKTAEFTNLAIDTAEASYDDDSIAKTYSSAAQNYQYIGDNDNAIKHYGSALQIFSRSDESYEQMAYNYEQASLVMNQLGNKAKAMKLQEKANLYYHKAQLQQEQLEAAS